MIEVVILSLMSGMVGGLLGFLLVVTIIKLAGSTEVSSAKTK